MTTAAGRGAYGAVVLEHFRRPHNHGRLDAPDLGAEGANALCGDRVRIELATRDGTIREARFSGNACAVCTAAASLLTDWLRGRTLADAIGLGEDELLRWLGGDLPASRRGCALLPRETLRRALTGAASQLRVVGVVLAAGRGRRFGAQKLAAPLDGVPVVRRAVERLATEVDEVVVVVAPGDGEVRAAIATTGATVIENPDAEEGIGASIRAAVRAVGSRAGAVVIALGDQPSVAPGVVSALRRAHAAADADGSDVAAVVPRYRGVRGHPVLFGAAAFGELSALSGDVGARSILERDGARVRWVEVDAEVPADVDTPDDLAALSGAPPR